MFRVFFLFVLFGAAGRASAFTYRDYGPKELTYSQVASLIRGRDLRSIDELLPLLPESYRSLYNLVYESRSLQQATPLAPRVILYGRDGRFLMAFNGDPSLPGYNQLEMIEFNDQTWHFDFHLIEFPAAGRLNQSVRFSQTNPPLCLQCHRASPRPNWETYPFWPGFYESESHATNRSPAWELNGAEEEGNWKTFLAHDAHQGRYRFLVGIEKKYLTANNYSPSQYFDSEDYHYYDHYRDALPTTQMTHLMALLNGRRMARWIFDSPDYRHYRYTIFAALNGCENIENFVPPALAKNFPLSRAALYEQTRKVLEASPNSFDTGWEFEKLLPDLRYLFENRGLDISVWSMNFRGHSWGFVSPVIPPGIGIRNPLLELDPELADFVSRAHSLCSDLRQASLSALGALP